MWLTKVCDAHALNLNYKSAFTGTCIRHTVLLVLQDVRRHPWTKCTSLLGTPSGGQSQVKSQTSWRNKHPESRQILLNPELFTDGRGAQISQVLGLKSGVTVSSLLFIDLTAAVIPGGVLHCRVLICCNADWSWRGNVLYFMNVMLQGREGKEKNQSLR